MHYGESFLFFAQMLFQGSCFFSTRVLSNGFHKENARPALDDLSHDPAGRLGNEFAAEFSHFPPGSFSMFFCRLLKKEKMMMIQISWSIFSPAKCEESARARRVILKVTSIDGGAPGAHPALASLPTTSRDTAAGVPSRLCYSWRHRGPMWSPNQGPPSWIVPESALSLLS